MGDGWLWVDGPTLAYDFTPWYRWGYEASKALPIKIKNPCITVVRFGYTKEGRVALKLKDTGFSFFEGDTVPF